ncbi:MAG TPA: TonB family protein [Candidatus Acidoferrum sp.]|jgi:TonB family protein|nr:TonB family protein [Candidatus Acidoferrum sp.]
MTNRSSRLLTAVVLGAIPLASFPLAASAQTSQFYSPPKVVKQGTNTTPVAGSGTVEVKVFVKKDGSVGSTQVLKSSNHADDRAALEIAKTSTYKPGARDAKPEDAYYTFVLRFSGSSVQANTGSAGGGEVVQANALIRAGKYDEAKTQLQSYLTAHPGDKDASALLGVADSYLNDSAGAATAFDAAGAIPDRFKVVAAHAYTDAAVAALKEKNNDQAIALSGKALALQPSVNGLYVRGTAYANAQQYPQAIADLEKAKSQATSGKADATTMNAIDSALATAYVFGGQTDKGVALAQDIKRRDPSNTRIDDTLAGYYNQQAGAAIQAGKADQAVADLETGAKAVPSRAVALYSSAANVIAHGAKTPDDWKKVKAEADKALAIAPNDAQANFIAGIALGNAGDKTGATTALQKAKANVGSDADLSGKIDAALAQLNKK